MTKVTIDIEFIVTTNEETLTTRKDLVIVTPSGKMFPITIGEEVTGYDSFDLPEIAVAHLGEIPAPAPAPELPRNPWETRPVPAPAPDLPKNPWTRPVAPVPAPAPTKTPVKAGRLYAVDSDKGTYFIMTVESKAGRVYGKIFRENNWSKSGFGYEYEPGLVGKIERFGRPATEAEVAEFGHRTGRCMICGRELTNPDSIERGIGPICASKL